MSNAQPFRPESRTAAASSPIGSPRNVVLAYIGLLSLMADETSALLERSVQRGSVVVEQAQAEARRRRAAPPEAAPQTHEEGQTDLSRPGLPTHRDFEALLQHMTALEQQIVQIAARRAASR